MAAKGSSRHAKDRDVAQNRRAFFEYQIVERFEAGLVLQGSEVKGLRAGGASIADAYAQMRGGEAFLIGAHIGDYERARDGHDVRRSRKLLLHRREIERIAAALSQKGLALVPLRLYFNEAGRAKIELGLGRGKSVYDKRQTIAERDARRESDRAMKAVRRR